MTIRQPEFRREGVAVVVDLPTHVAPVQMVAVEEEQIDLCLFSCLKDGRVLVHMDEQVALRVFLMLMPVGRLRIAACCCCRQDEKQVY